MKTAYDIIPSVVEPEYQQFNDAPSDFYFSDIPHTYKEFYETPIDNPTFIETSEDHFLVHEHPLEQHAVYDIDVGLPNVHQSNYDYYTQEIKQSPINIYDYEMPCDLQKAPTYYAPGSKPMKHDVYADYAFNMPYDHQYSPDFYTPVSTPIPKDIFDFGYEMPTKSAPIDIDTDYGIDIPHEQTYFADQYKPDFKPVQKDVFDYGYEMPSGLQQVPTYYAPGTKPVPHDVYADYSFDMPQDKQRNPDFYTPGSKRVPKDQFDYGHYDSPTPHGVISYDHPDLFIFDKPLQEPFDYSSYYLPQFEGKPMDMDHNKYLDTMMPNIEFDYDYEVFSPEEDLKHLDKPIEYETFSLPEFVEGFDGIMHSLPLDNFEYVVPDMPIKYEILEETAVCLDNGVKTQYGECWYGVNACEVVSSNHILLLLLQI